MKRDTFLNVLAIAAMLSFSSCSAGIAPKSISNPGNDISNSNEELDEDENNNEIEVPADDKTSKEEKTDKSGEESTKKDNDKVDEIEKEPIEISLTNISVLDYQTSYSFGDPIDHTNTIIIGEFSDGTNKEINEGLIFEPSQGTILNQAGLNEVMVTHFDTNLKCTYNVNVSEDEIKSLKVENYKDTYFKGEYLDYSDLVVKGVFSSGKEVDVTSNCDFELENGTRLLEEGYQTIKIKHEESNSSYDLVINVLPATISSIKIDEESVFKTDYLYNEALDLSGLHIDAIKTDDSILKNITEDCSFSLANGSILTSHGTKEIIATHNPSGFTCSFFINVGTIIKSISIENQITSFINGELFSSSGAIVKAHLSDGTIQEVTDFCSFDISNTTKLIQPGKHTVEVTHNPSGKKCYYEINVGNVFVTSIEANVTTTSYKNGDKFSLKDTVIIAKMSDGSTQDITQNCSFNVAEGTKLINPGKQTIKVTHSSSNKTCEFEINVGEVFVSSLSISGQKTSYVNGEKFTTFGAVVSAELSDGNVENVTEGCTFNLAEGKNLIIPGQQTVTVTHTLTGKTCSYDITVGEVFISSISISGQKNSYINGESFTYEGSVISAQLSNGESQDVTDGCTFSIVKDTKLIKPGKQTITVTHTASKKTCQFDLTVGEVFISSISISDQKTTFLNGESFGIGDGVITAHLSDGSTENITQSCTFSVSTGTKLINPGEQTIIVTHGASNKTCSYKINVGEVYISSLTVSGQKDNYINGETFTNANTVVTANLSNGNKENVTSDCTFNVANGTKMINPGEQTITVTHTISKKTCSFKVIVGDVLINSLTISGQKTSFAYNEAFSTSGIVVTASKSNGTTENVKSQCSFSVADGTKLTTPGYQNITVTHTASGKTCSYQIFVEYYQKVSYIYSSGSQYIDTGIKPTSSTKIQTRFMNLQATGAVIIGNQNSDSDDFRFFDANNKCYLDYVNQRIEGSTISCNVEYEIEIGTPYVKNLKTGSNIISGSSYTFSQRSYSICLNYDPWAYNHSKNRYYYLKIYEGSTLKRDLVPCVLKGDLPASMDSRNVARSKGTAGMWDLVSNKFFGNVNSDNFLYQQ